MLSAVAFTPTGQYSPLNLVGYGIPTLAHMPLRVIPARGCGRGRAGLARGGRPMPRVSLTPRAGGCALSNAIAQPALATAARLCRAGRRGHAVRPAIGWSDLIGVNRQSASPIKVIGLPPVTTPSVIVSAYEPALSPVHLGHTGWLRPGPHGGISSRRGVVRRCALTAWGFTNSERCRGDRRPPIAGVESVPVSHRGPSLAAR